MRNSARRSSNVWCRLRSDARNWVGLKGISRFEKALRERGVGKGRVEGLSSSLYSSSLGRWDRWEGGGEGVGEGEESK